MPPQTHDAEPAGQPPNTPEQKPVHTHPANGTEPWDNLPEDGPGSGNELAEGGSEGPGVGGAAPADVAGDRAGLRLEPTTPRTAREAGSTRTAGMPSTAAGGALAPGEEPCPPRAGTPRCRATPSGDGPGPGRPAPVDVVGEAADVPPDVAGGERGAAVRRGAGAGRRWRRARAAGCAVLLAVALTGGAVAAGAARDGASAPAVVSAAAVSPGLLSGGDLDAGVAAVQAHLRAQPRDFAGWAVLGLAYVEQARVQGDPSRYPQADRALRRSLRLAPDNDQALAGRAALAAARHDFTAALRHADRALARNPYSERALCSRIDALVELGRYEEASRAADTADERRPGVPVFTRYAYVRELRGEVGTARRVLERALVGAVAPGDVAYVATQLGHLAWNQGDHKTALAHYARALAADETYLPALEGRARAQAASGDRAAAVRGLEAVVARSPLPGPLVELGELYEARGAPGDAARARDQYALVGAWTALARAGGVDADLDTALAAADHGDRAAALRAARAEWTRRRSVHTADALAWALHVNGRDREALPYARRATATGYRNASFLHHRGMIELAVGDRRAGRASLTAALRLNPGFSPLGAAGARAALRGAEAAE
ncbi:tetratricopeptide repeat protein [Streptomyces sp. NPDC004629]|uniref:tetratricopeptide repeat protein n=1 Tax=Streptomyces sp. NPDC004629 TaxID=3364705 RepID=UPI0036ABDCA1